MRSNTTAQKLWFTIGSTRNQIAPSTGSGGSTSPGGADTQVQFNDGGAFGGDPLFTYAKASQILTTRVFNATVILVWGHGHHWRVCIAADEH